jgi:SAM-dependent methyltransferase
MTDATVLRFVATCLSRAEVEGRSIVELGSRNSTIRPLLAAWHPAEYVGVDLRPGPAVDLVSSAADAPRQLHGRQFDLVLSTEMLEHVRDWQGAVLAMKRLCRPGGRILLTTRSPGFLYHGSPFDFWRFDGADLRSIFEDCQVLACEPDPAEPGIFLFAAVPAGYGPTVVEERAIYSIVLGRRTGTLPDGLGFRLRRAWVAGIDWFRWAVRRNMGPLSRRMHGGH